MQIKQSNDRSQGFTLIELLIVIIIIGILAAIAFIAFNGTQNKAHKADAQSTLAETKSKMAEYNADHSTYPATIGDADNWLSNSEGGNNSTLAGKFTGAAGYSYAVTPTGCGDTVSASGVITTGSTACSGFTLTAAATIWGDSNSADNISVTN